MDLLEVSNLKIAQPNGERQQSAAWWFLCDFSAEELFILRSSFGAVKHRLENVAVAAFTDFFDVRPDAFSVFVGKKVLPSNRDEVRYSWETTQHGLRVLSIVERCLNRIEKWELFEEIVSNLAARHLGYGAKPVHLLSLFGCLRDALLKEMAAADEESQQRTREDNNAAKCELSVTAINSAWNKFFRTLGLAIVAEMLTLQETVSLPSPVSPAAAIPFRALMKPTGPTLSKSWNNLSTSPTNNNQIINTNNNNNNTSTFRDYSLLRP